MPIGLVWTLGLVSNVVEVLLPLIPAILTYRVAPDKPIKAEGALSGLTIRVSGAFAAYLIVLLASHLSWLTLWEVLGAAQNPNWKVEGYYEVRDANGQRVSDPNLVDAVNITLSPKLQSAEKGKLRLQMPGNPDEWEVTLQLQIPEYGGSEPVDLRKKLWRKVSSSRISIDDVIIVSQNPASLTGGIGAGLKE